MNAPFVPDEMIEIINACREGAKVVAFSLPSRSFRIVDVHSDNKTYCVEQFLPTSQPRPGVFVGEWKERSVHANPKPFAARLVAFQAMVKAENTLRKLITEKMEQNRKAFDAVKAGKPIPVVPMKKRKARLMGSSPLGVR